ncbi:MAG: hypothetical protein HC866_21220 [Leptolyngbyaceae cyanobacterium RU_5_1]|nr:hypothetical protein [Leptolyngbyaceae cyanobacterium RU_5_1]
MTRVENIHVIVKSDDRVVAFGNEASQSVSLTIDNFPQTFTLTLNLQHIPQLEQLLTLLWAMKEEQETKTQQQLETALKDAEAREYLLAAAGAEEF